MKKYKKYSPAAIANNFLWLAKQDNKKLTPMKLVKLVYFAYGWALVLLDRPLFSEDVQAWKHGPVVPSVYDEFKRFGSSPIDTFASQSVYDFETGEIDATFPLVDPEDEDVLAIITAIWSRYKDKSAWELSKLTHEDGAPWSKVYEEGLNKKLDDAHIKERCLEVINKVYRQ